MIVFSDTTPIIALCSIQRLELLQQLFTRIHVVTEVIEECMAGGPIVVPDLRRLNWIEVVESTAVVHPSVLLELDKGEKHTIDMARKLNVDWVVPAHARGGMAGPHHSR